MEIDVRLTALETRFHERELDVNERLGKLDASHLNREDSHARALQSIAQTTAHTQDLVRQMFQWMQREFGFRQTPLAEGGEAPAPMASALDDEPTGSEG